MSVKKINEHMADVNKNTGAPIMYIEATYETGDTLPTDNIYQGSWALNLDSKDVVFFNADTNTWG